MSSLQTHLQDPNHINWLKARHCLNYTKTGLEDFAEAASQSLHQSILNSIIPTFASTAQPVCGVRIMRQGLLVAICDHPYCQSFIKEIVKIGLDPNHPFTPRHGNLANCNTAQLHSHHWQVAKLFMNSGQRPTDVHPRQTELSGILNFLAHCKIPRNAVKNIRLIDEVRVARNSITHADDMKLSAGDLQLYARSMIELLTDTGIYSTPTAQLAVKNIQSLLNATDFTISLGDEKQEMDKPASANRAQTKETRHEIEAVTTEDDKERQPTREELNEDTRNPSGLKDGAYKNAATHRQMQELPPEILRMDKQSVALYKKALEEGNEKDYSIRIMVIGPYGVGKSALTKRLLCQDVDINERNSTDGIDVHVKKCKVSLETSEWIIDNTDSKEKSAVERRLAQVLKSTRENSSADKITEDATGLAKSTETKGIENKVELAREQLQDLDYVQNEARGLPIQSVVDDTDVSTDGDRLKHEELLLKELKDVLQVADEADDDVKADVSIWDFGGQFAFYSTHQMFLSHRAVYILVNNMSQHIDEIVTEDKSYFDCRGSKNLRIGDFLDIWLNSIHGNSDRERQGAPPVILVGTHADKFNSDKRDEKTEAVFNAIRDRFVGNDVSLHFIDKDFGLRNDVIDPKLNDLRQTILDMVKQQPYWGELKPAKWIHLERLLENLRRDGVEIMSRSEVESLNDNSLPVKLADDELDLFLDLQHKKGIIMFFNVPGLQNNIVLSPQFLVNALKSLITAEMFCKKKAVILENWMEFDEKGVLRPCLIDALWDTDENRKFKDNRDHILALMEHLNIIANPKHYVDDKEETIDHDKNYYLVPCMLKKYPPEDVLNPDKAYISTSCLCLGLENNAFPSAIFNRLIVGCMDKWPLARNKGKDSIYCGCGQFDVRQLHRLTIAFHQHSIESGYRREYPNRKKSKSFEVISLRITRFSAKNRDPDPNVCADVHRTVKQILKRISSYLSLTYEEPEEFIQCPSSATASKMCLLPVESLNKSDEFVCNEHEAPTIVDSSEMLKYWFDKQHEGVSNAPLEQKQDDEESPITQDHINHARVCNALVTVCADALREILLSKVPTRYTSIYAAIKANSGKLSHLRKEQKSLVYPDPKKRFTGTVDQFDITILYTLIRNISSVQKPRNDWGHSPDDNPRDTSLGANVERIRECRNKVSGHSVDGKLDNQSLQNYWREIEDIIDDIENAIGDRGFKNALERRKNQIITPEEAHLLKIKINSYQEQIQEKMPPIVGAMGNVMEMFKELQTAVDAKLSP